VKKLGLLGAVCSVTFLFSHSAPASVLTLDEYSGVDYDSTDPFPIAPVTVGTFSVPTGITSATINGTFGNFLAPSSAGVDLFLDGILVGQCVKNAPCWGSALATPWSYTFAVGELSIFDDGQAVLTAVQTSEFVIRLGVTELDFTVVPIPAAAWLFGSGLLGMIGVARRKKAA
jgi:hypothetical protein